MLNHCTQCLYPTKLRVHLSRVGRTGFTSSLVAFVTRSIHSLWTLLLLPESVYTLIRDCGDRTLHGSTSTLCLLCDTDKKKNRPTRRHRMDKENIKLHSNY